MSVGNASLPSDLVSTNYLTMNAFHFDNPDSYYECYKEQVEHVTKMMVILDGTIIQSNLPPVGKTKELFDMVNDMLYAVEKRYKKKNNIPEDDGDFVYFGKNDMLDSMRTLLQEEVTRYFDQLSGAAK